jgi:hypothetical protein
MMSRSLRDGFWPAAVAVSMFFCASATALAKSPPS